MYFDAAAVFVTSRSLLFKLALVILKMLTKLKNRFYVTPCFRSLYSQNYEIKFPPWTILWFRILGIFSVENKKRMCVFMFQT